MTLSLQDVQAAAGRGLDALAAWAETTGDGSADPEALVSAGLRVVDELAQKLRELAGNNQQQAARDDRGPAVSDGVDMSKAVQARRQGLPTKTIFDRAAAPDPKPSAPPGFWPRDLSASVSARKKVKG